MIAQKFSFFEIFSNIYFVYIVKTKKCFGSNPHFFLFFFLFTLPGCQIPILVYAQYCINKYLFVLICNYFVLFKCKRWLGSMFGMLTYNLTCAWVDDHAELLVHPCRAEVWCTCLIINVVYYLVHTSPSLTMATIEGSTTF